MRKIKLRIELLVRNSNNYNSNLKYNFVKTSAIIAKILKMNRYRQEQRRQKMFSKLDNDPSARKDKIKALFRKGQWERALAALDRCVDLMHIIVFTHYSQSILFQVIECQICIYNKIIFKFISAFLTRIGWRSTIQMKTKNYPGLKYILII